MSKEDFFCQLTPQEQEEMRAFSKTLYIEHNIIQKASKYYLQHK